ncbi:MAG: hypothetical protein K8R53_08210, partial [Bacteroidales bacterium]|nr:hypothetical protein [Bacteroidales bacterium]
MDRKRFFTLIIVTMCLGFLGIHFSSTAQVDDDNYYSVYQVRLEYFQEQAVQYGEDMSLVPGYKGFRVWALEMINKHGEDGSLAGYMEAMNNYVAGLSDVLSEKTFEWEYIARDSLWPHISSVYPSSSPGQGLVISLWAEEENPLHIMAGTFCSGGLWETSDGGNNWRNITDNYRQIQSVNSIDVNPNDTNEIWVSFGTTLARSEEEYLCKKVYVSNDMGESWEPMALGLPEDIPAHEIRYIPETDNLYLTNDVGVYYFDRQDTLWKNMTGDLPPMTFNGVRYSPFEKKLRISSTGRGVWETDAPCYYNSANSETITGDETWNCSILMNGDLEIDSGAVLTIKKAVYFPPEADLVVKRGGRLIIDGGTLTNACNNLWKGVEVWGTHDVPPNTDGAHGKIELKNGAIIENAVTGIKTVRIIEQEGSDPVESLDYAGGQIVASNSTIRNCRTGVYIPPYGYDSWCTFINCNFETTKELVEESIAPDALVKLSGVSNIKIWGCSFSNTRPVEDCPVEERGKGLWSFDAEFDIRGHCISGDVPCTEMKLTEFNELYYGIYALAPLPNRTFTVDTTLFYQNYRGFYVSAVPVISITNNIFDFWTENDPDAYCLYLDECTGYTIENNEFTGKSYHGQVGSGIGVIVNNSGEEPNMIYRNWFTKLEIGILAQQVNRGRLEGLELKCNDYDLCVMDEVVTWDGETPDYVGIAPDQGSPGPSPDYMAGNLFDIHSQIPNDDFDDINNEANHITYYYPLDPETGFENVKPIDFTENTVDLQGIGEFTWNFEDGCPPSETPGGGGGIDGLMDQMAEAQFTIDSTENILSLLIDAGDTETLQTEVDNSLPPETWEIYNGLMGNSPYLSDTVISTAIEKEDVLPNAMIRDIMLANPHTAKSDELMDKLDERWIPLPQYMKAQILQGRSIVSIREETEAKLAAYKQRKAKALNMIIKYYLCDTVSPQSSLDSLIGLFQSENGIIAKYNLAFLFLEQGPIASGVAVLSAIPAQFDLTAKQSETHMQITNYYTLLSSLKQQGKYFLQADSLNIATLVNIKVSKLPRVSVYTRNILLALNETEYEEPIILPDLLKSSEALEDYKELVDNTGEATRYLNIHPNPASEYLVIEYDLREKIGQFTIEIIDIIGNLQYS